MLPADQLEQYITTAMHRIGIPGLAIAIIRDGSISYANALGATNTADRIPQTLETPFQAASLSKPVFAYAVLKLCEQGLLDLDTPLSNYWNDPSVDMAEASLITARHVLSHTTGFPNWRADDRLIIEATPGERFGYSGEGYEYLQRVVEQLTAQPLYAYMQEHILTPLGMEHSSFAWGVDDAGEFMLDDAGNVLPPGPRVASSAAFSLLTTAPDYARFLLAILNPGEGANAQLSASGVAAMLTPQAHVGTQARLSWGLGWGIQRTELGIAFWHWGGPQNGYTSYTIAFPGQQSGVVILTNGENGLQVCEDVARASLEQTVRHPAFDWLLPVERWSSTA